MRRILLSIFLSKGINAVSQDGDVSHLGFMPIGDIRKRQLVSEKSFYTKNSSTRRFLLERKVNKYILQNGRSGHLGSMHERDCQMKNSIKSIISHIFFVEK